MKEPNLLLIALSLSFKRKEGNLCLLILYPNLKSDLELVLTQLAKLFTSLVVQRASRKSLPMNAMLIILMRILGEKLHSLTNLDYHAQSFSKKIDFLCLEGKILIIKEDIMLFIQLRYLIYQAKNKNGNLLVQQCLLKLPLLDF